MNGKLKRAVVDRASLPLNWPTHLHTSAFWAALGRAVATFGFLEKTLGRAIFAHTATTEYAEHEIAAAFRQWLPKPERALSESLGGLIDF